MRSSDMLLSKHLRIKQRVPPKLKGRRWIRLLDRIPDALIQGLGIIAFVDYYLGLRIRLDVLAGERAARHVGHCGAVADSIVEFDGIQQSLEMDSGESV